jgi:glycosyltransferase involved in cell wall biosynthesis
MMRQRRFLVNALEFFQRKIANCYDIIAPNSNYQLKWIVKFTKIPKNKLVLLRNGIEHTKIDQKLKNTFKKKFGRNKIIAIASRLVPWKGIQYAIKALNYLDNEFKLVIAGSGPYEPYLKRITESENLLHRVEFIGKIPHQHIRSFIAASDVFVLPSLYEPSALALLDGLAAGKPIIATNVGGTPEIIKHKKNGLLVRPRDPYDIAEKIKLITNNNRLANKIRKNQNRTVKKYLWKNIVKSYIKTYEKLI